MEPDDDLNCCFFASSIENFIYLSETPLRPTSDMTSPFACPWRRDLIYTNQRVAWWQWIGVACLFGGLSLNVQAKNSATKRQLGPLESPKASIVVVPLNAVAEDMKLI